MQALLSYKFIDCIHIILAVHYSEGYTWLHLLKDGISYSTRSDLTVLFKMITSLMDTGNSIHYLPRKVKTALISANIIGVGSIILIR